MIGRDDTELLDAFAEHLSSRRRAEGTIRLRMLHVRWLSKDHALASVTAKDLDRWCKRYGAGKRPETINSVIKSIRVFYGWADRWDVIRPNPATLLDLVPNPHRASRIASDGQIAAALERATPQFAAMVLLGRLGGLRLSEIAGLHTSNDDGQWLTIIGKGSKQRRVYVVPALRNALDRIRPSQPGFYFPGRFEGHLHPMSISKKMQRDGGFNTHALRHAAGTAVYGATKDLRAAQEFLGHSSPTTTAIYTHVSDDLVAAAARAGAGGWSA